MTDTEGTVLRVYVDDRIVTHPDGPDGEIPSRYAFCDSDVFQGTYSH